MDLSGEPAAMPAAHRALRNVPGRGILGSARGGIHRECGNAMLLAAAVLASLVCPSGAAQELRYGTFRWEQVNFRPRPSFMHASFILQLPRGDLARPTARGCEGRGGR